MEKSDFFDEIFTRMLPRLRSLAHLYLRRERPDATLRTTALVNELYVELREKLASGALEHDDVARITGALTRQMLYILRDEFDKRSAQKRGGGQIQVSLDDGDVVDTDFVRDQPLIEAQLELLKLYPATHNIFSLSYEFGHTLAEVSELLGLKIGKIDREKKFALRFLRDRMGDRRSLFTKRFVEHLREQA